MLIEFRVENFRSLRDEQVLSMEATSGPTAADPRPRVVPGHDKPLLPVAAIYGANASGKSNVLAAFELMCGVVRFSSLQSALPGSDIPNPIAIQKQLRFAWGPSSCDPTLFEATIVLNGDRIRFGFAARRPAGVKIPAVGG